MTDNGVKSITRKQIRDEMNRVCAKCGERYGRHGAAPPHDRGDECSGFDSKEGFRRG